MRQPKLKIQSVTFDKFIRNTYRNPYETAKMDEELFEIEHYFKRQRAGTKRWGTVESSQISRDSIGIKKINGILLF